MRCRSAAVLAILLALAAPVAADQAEQYVHLSLQVDLVPATHRLAATVEITLPAGTDAGRGFLLAAPMRITRAEPAVEEVPLGDVAPFFGSSSGAATPDSNRVKRYRFTTAPAAGLVRLAYEGAVNHPLSPQKEEYTRGFRETAGLIGPEGVYLAGTSFWYPHFGDALVTFILEIHVPEGWHLVSQGDGTSRDAQGRARWSTTAPMEEIYLVGGPLRVWRDSAGSVETLVYLRQDDPGLAARYLAATAQYLEMYRGLIGAYPYSKFAMVENFWETGYGMPSFTLLGPSVLRFPWILNSSYPHEILHNWWGNGVLVDYATGNWSEGLTAYLADHLFQEQRGRGDEYRRATLQKYRNYVKAERDFPLAAFRARENAATEAVGYGKTLMGVHMLRRRLGDDRFRAFLARLYREYRGKRASFADLKHVAESLAGESLARFFHDWIARPGAAALAVQVDTVRRDGAKHIVEGTLTQVQDDEPFAVDVPVALQTADGAMSKTTIGMTARTAAVRITSEAEPIALLVDPQFDVFRRLDPLETPPSIGQIFGEPRATAVLPSSAPADSQTAYRELAQSWRSASHEIAVVLDSELASLPAGRAVWLLGRENRFASHVARSAGLQVEPEGIALATESVAWANHTIVATARHPADADRAIGWIVVDPRAAFAGLSRKLPHYGRYSYLAFEGAEPVNTVKGEWAAADSPLRVDLRPAAMRTSAPLAVSLPAGKPLADLPPAFSQKALKEHLTWLAAPEREGRGIGTKSLDEASRYLADRFKEIGLTPGGDAGAWFQHFVVPQGPSGGPVQTSNVVGYLPGTKPEWQTEPVLVTAHYDHLGAGWPEARRGEEGRVHPGADDNASGVAVLIELARALAAGEKPQRPIVFVALSAEEAGLLGSKHFADHPTPFPLAGVMGVINLDTVGRLGTGKVSILGADTATEWPHIFRGASFVTGVESVPIPGSFEASDQRTFIERGIPAVQIFTGPHADYHRPGDTADRVDAAGLVKVATLVKEALVYLAGRAEPLTNTTPVKATTARDAAPAGAAGAGAPAGTPPRAAGGRRVSFGAVPDFAFQGPGVRLSAVTPGSPAEKAGVRAGDVIVRLGDAPIASLREFSEALRTLAPGQTVPVVLLRDGTEQTVSVTVVER